MKRFGFMIFACVIVPLALLLSESQATLPFGPGVKNGQAAYTKVYADSVIVGGSYVGGVTADAVSDTADAIRAIIPAVPPVWSTGLPSIIDTLQTGKDSLTVVELADMVNLPTEYATYLHVFGNGSAAADSVFIVTLILPKDTDPDSVYWWVKASAGADSAGYGVTISQKTAAGTDAPFVQGHLGATLMNTWERKAFAFLDFNEGDYAVTVRFRIVGSANVNISPIYFK
jgi:hypothetical protein